MSHVKNRNFKEALYFYEEAQKIEYNEPTQIAIRGLKKELKSNNTSTNSNSSNSGYKSNTSSSNNTSSAYSTSNSYNTTTSAQDEVIADGVMALAQGLGSLLSGNNNTYRVSESDKKERREKLRINLASWNNNEDFNALEKVLFTGYPRYTRYNDEYLPNKKYDAKFHEDLLWMYLTHSSTRKFSKYTAIGLDDLGDLHINKEAITYFKLAYRQGSCLGKKLVSKRRIKYIKNSIIRILGKSEANSWFKNIKKNDNCNKVKLDFEKFKIDNLREEYKRSTSEVYENDELTDNLQNVSYADGSFAVGEIDATDHFATWFVKDIMEKYAPGWFSNSGLLT